MATYFLRNDGTASSKNEAIGPITDPSKCMNVSVHNTQSFKINDRIIIGEQGGIITSMIVAPSNGVKYLSDDNPVRLTGTSINPTFTKTGDVYVTDLSVPVFDVFLFTNGISAEYAFIKNTNTPTTPNQGEWGQVDSKLYIRLKEDEDPLDAIRVVTSPQVFNVVGKSDVSIDNFIIPFSAYYDWHGHLGGIVFNNNCTNCQALNITASFCQHSLTIYSGSTNCLADNFKAVNCYSAGVAIAQGFPNQNNTGSILRNSKFLKCGLEGGGAFSVVAHGATETGQVINALIENCVIDQGTEEDIWGHGLSTWLSNGVKVLNCTINGFKRNGKDGISSANTAKNTSFINNTITNCFNGINVNGNTKILGNFIKNAGYCCIKSTNGSGVIVNNTLNANNKSSGYPLGLWNSNYSHVSNNNFLSGRYSVRDMSNNSSIDNFINNNEFDCRDTVTVSTIVTNQNNTNNDPGPIGKHGKLFPGSSVVGTGIKISEVNELWVDRYGNEITNTPNIGCYQGIPKVSTADLTIYVNSQMNNDSGDGLTLATAKKYVSSAIRLIKQNTSNPTTKKIIIVEGKYNDSRDYIHLNDIKLNNLIIEGAGDVEISTPANTTLYCLTSNLNVKVDYLIISTGAVNQSVVRSTVNSKLDLFDSILIAPKNHENRYVVEVHDGIFNMDGCKIYSSFWKADSRNSVGYRGSSSGKISNCLIVPLPEAVGASTFGIATSGDVEIDNSIILGAISHGVMCSGTGNTKITNSIIGGCAGNKSSYPVFKTAGNLSIGNSFIIPNSFDPIKIIKGEYTDLGGNITSGVNPGFKQFARKGYILPSIDDSGNLNYVQAVENILKKNNMTATFFFESVTWKEENNQALRDLVKRGTFEIGSHSRTHSSMSATGKIWDLEKESTTFTMDREAGTINLSTGESITNFKTKELKDIKIELEGFGVTVSPTSLYSTKFSVSGKVYEKVFGEAIKIVDNTVEIHDDPSGNEGYFKTEMADTKENLELIIGDITDPQTRKRYTCNSFGCPYNSIGPNGRAASKSVGYLSLRGMYSDETLETGGKNVIDTDMYRLFVISMRTNIVGRGRSEEIVRLNSRALAFAFAEYGLVASLLSHNAAQDGELEVWEWMLDEFSKYKDQLKVCSQQIFAKEVRKNNWSVVDDIYSKPLTINDADYSFNSSSPLLEKGIGLIQELTSKLKLRWTSIDPKNSLVGDNPIHVGVETSSPDGLDKGQSLEFSNILDLNRNGSLVIRMTPVVDPDTLSDEKHVFGPIFLTRDGIIVNDGTNKAKCNCIWEKDENLTILVKVNNRKISIGKILTHGERVEKLRSGKKFFTVAYIDPGITVQQNQEAEVAKFPLALVPQDIRPIHVKWRDKIRSINPNIVFLAYQLTIEETTVPGPGHDIMRQFGDKGWVLDSDGTPFTVEISPGKFRKMYDPRTPGWKDMMVEACGAVLRSYDYDGLFLDQCTIFRKVAPDTTTFNSMKKALNDTLQAIRNAYPHVILVGNSKYHWPMLNGQMNEDRPNDFDIEFGPDKKQQIPRINLAVIDAKNRDESEIINLMNKAHGLNAYFSAFTSYQTAQYWPYYG